MKSVEYFSFIFICIAIFCVGCSTSVPLSEAYIFNKDKVLTDNLYPKTDSLRWESSKGGVISFHNNAGAVETYLKEDHEAETFGNLNKIAAGFSSASANEYFSFGYNIGYNLLGVNTTFGVGWGNYLTLNGTISGGEVILQRKLFQTSGDNSHGGVTLGAFAKRNYYSYNKETENALDIFIDIHGIRDLAAVDLYGGRSMIHWRFFDDVMVHGFAGYGYSPQLDDFILNVGFTFGFDNFR